MAEMAIELAILRMVFVGKIERLWMAEEQKSAIVLSVEEAKSKGVARIRACAMSMIIAGMWSDGLGTASKARDLIMASPFRNAPPAKNNCAHGSYAIELRIA